MDKKRSLKILKEIYQSVPPEDRNALDRLYQCLDYENYSPVKRMEQKLGISGIYTNYKFPQGMEAADYESLMKPLRIFEMLERGHQGNSVEEEIAARHLLAKKEHFLPEIRQMYDELTNLNPELKTARIIPDRIRSYVAVISGACSGFPVQDIVEFSLSTSDEKNTALNNRKREMSAELEQLTGKTHQKGETPLIENWCPSETTYQKIKQACIEQKSAQKPQTNPRTSSFDYDAYQNFLESRGYFND
ncbi:MAG: hypothetical protein J6A33_01190 [Alphaproteobacteria bacterium]|nr:hypothetical protein [Alphaproteobacteria bacterium]